MAALVSTSPDPTADRLARSVLTRRLNLRPKENVTIEAYRVRCAGPRGSFERPDASEPDRYSTTRTRRRTGRRSTQGKPPSWAPPGEHEWAALENTDVYIYFWGPEDTARRDRLPDRVQSQLTAFNGRWYEVAKKSGVRGARMTIARVTEANARRWGVSPRAWMNEVMAASLRDPATLRAPCRKGPAGPRERPVAAAHPSQRNRPHPGAREAAGPCDDRGSDPRLSEGAVRDDGKRPRRVCLRLRWTKVPPMGPSWRTDPRPGNGSALRGGRWTFENGRLREFQFSEGGAKFGSEYRSAAPGKDRPALIEVGLDPSVRYAPMLEEAEAGAVTVGVGRNVGFGGKTKGDFLAYITLGGGELSVDGRPLVRRGKVVSG